MHIMLRTSMLIAGLAELRYSNTMHQSITEGNCRRHVNMKSVLLEILGVKGLTVQAFYNNEDNAGRKSLAGTTAQIKTKGKYYAGSYNFGQLQQQLTTEK